jgi:hypothetical protein
MTTRVLLALLPLTACAPVPADDDAALSERLDALEAQHAAEVAALSVRLDAAEAANGVLASRVDDLASENASLAERLEQSELALADVAARLDVLEDGGGGGASTPGLTRLGEVLTVDVGGDLYLDGVNLWIRSGVGATTATPNGKGNLLLGYGEALGTESRTGSHTLVIGPYHDWTAAWGIVSGEANGLYADGGALIGGRANSVMHANAVDAGGTGVTSSYTCGFRGSGLQSGSGC